VTTSSPKKGILPVRLGLQPDTKTALAELKMDVTLADRMNDQQLDELIIENEYLRILDYYTEQGLSEEGKTNAHEWKKQALAKVNATK
tara:strand:+ start:659 stop:922 length:264 start_codon:yes stop_codon:yes gene_type:complete